MQFSHPKRALVALLVLCIPLVLAGGAAGSAVSTVPLGTTEAFAILAGTGITDVPTSAITGSIGVSPATGATIGVACSEVTGHTYAVDLFGPGPCSEKKPGLLTTATNDETAAFGNAAGRSPDRTYAPGTDNQLGGHTLVPGVYRFGSAPTANLIGNLTLKGDASSVWIFQATSDLVTASSSTVTLSGGAQACHVFWEVSSSATLGSSSKLKGTVLAGTSITVGNGVQVTGRLLAQATVTLIADAVLRPACASASPATGGSSPSREIYCDPLTGQTYDLEVGQDKLPPYDKLNLVPATVDPLTGAKSCAAAVAVVTATTTATTTTAATTTTTTTTPTPVPVKPAPKRHPAKKHVAGAHAAKAPKRRAPRPAHHVPPQPAVHAFGITG